MTGFHSQSASHDNTSAQRDDLHELTINLDTDIRTGAIKNSWDAASYREVLHYKQAPLLQKLLDLHQFTGSETVLDLGCGEGYLGSSAVVPRVPNGRYIGADISPEMLALADPLFAEIPNATVTHGDLLNLEDLFQRENLRKKVDVVVSNEALHWIADREQHKRIWQDLHDNLAPGSVALVSQVGEGGWGDINDAVERVKLSPRYQSFFEGYKAPFLAPTAGDYAQMLSQVGFHSAYCEVVKFEAVFDGPQGFADWFYASVSNSMKRLEGQPEQFKREFTMAVAESVAEHRGIREDRSITVDFFQLLVKATRN